MGRNTRAGKECRQPEVAVDRITKCRKSRTSSRDAWENGDGGAFGHDTRGDSGLCRNIAQNTNLGKKPNAIMARRREILSPASYLTPLRVDPRPERPRSGC